MKNCHIQTFTPDFVTRASLWFVRDLSKSWININSQEKKSSDTDKDQFSEWVVYIQWLGIFRLRKGISESWKWSRLPYMRTLCNWVLLENCHPSEISSYSAAVFSFSFPWNMSSDSRSCQYKLVSNKASDINPSFWETLTFASTRTFNTSS